MKQIIWPENGSYIYKVKLKILFQRIMFNLPFIARVFRSLGNRLLNIGKMHEQELKRRNSISLVRDAKGDALSLGSNYGYEDEIREFMVTFKYFEQIENKDFATQSSESYLLYQLIIEKFSNLIAANPNIKKVFNFGVCYGYVDWLLAKKFPKIKFIGIDRSKYTQIFNEDKLGGLKNLEFVTSDIFVYLAKKDFSDSVFFSARTMVYLPPEIISKIYAEVSKVNFEFILGFEQIGLSRETLKPYIFDENFRDSVLHRERFFIHNYPYLTKKAGFKNQTIELIKTNHPYPDYRIMYFEASNERKK